MLKRSSSPLSLADMARQLGVHVNTVRFHIEFLSRTGQVERVMPDQVSTGRPPFFFRAVRGMDPGGSRQYRLLAQVLALSLSGVSDSRGRAVEAGRTLGAALASDETTTHATTETSLLRLINLLEDLGFAPETPDSDDDTEIKLRHCPFLELAHSGDGVACPAHLGLMQGALEKWDETSTVETLEPFVEPDLCVAHLSTLPPNSHRR